MNIERDPDACPPVIAYFSMEVGLTPEMPTYSGGLGVLAGDTLRSAADLSVPLVGVTLLHREGFFRQRIDDQGNQSEETSQWSPEDSLELLPPVVSLPLGNRTVHIRAWRYKIQGRTRHTIPVYFLDTRCPENDPYDQTFTDRLYGGDSAYRLGQEAVLGMGGVLMMRALGHDNLRLYHMNEGHSALLTLALLDTELNGQSPAELTEVEIETVRQRCVFTTHTPVPAGHDKFPIDTVRRVLGKNEVALLESSKCLANGSLNMTHLALHFSRYINGVAMRHKQVSRDMFPNYPIDSITNGIHVLSWIVPAIARLFDRRISEWRRDSLYLRHAVSISSAEIREAHQEAKIDLLAEVKRRSGKTLDPDVLTLGFARRATTYKRADLLFSDLDRLRNMVASAGPLQILYAGKAHPKDTEGKEVIRKIYRAAAALGDDLRVIYLENYDMRLGKLLCGGVDLWLNTPRKPQEASGTSGMKAAVNGVPSLSILDGWWVEGHYEGVTGWSIGDAARESDDKLEAASLYDKLENVVIPLFYKDPDAYGCVMRAAIALNGSFFTSQRMMLQYVRNAYRPADPAQLAALLRQV